MGDVVADRPEPLLLLLPPRFTEPEAARELGISTDTVRRERKRGRLGYTRIGRRIFITLDQLHAYVAQQEHGTRAMPRPEARRQPRWLLAQPTAKLAHLVRHP